MITKEHIINVTPRNRDFRAIEIAEIVYPHLHGYDTEGRIYNKGVATTARMLRQITGVLEVTYGVFWCGLERGEG